MSFSFFCLMELVLNKFEQNRLTTPGVATRTSTDDQNVLIVLYEEILSRKDYNIAFF